MKTESGNYYDNFVNNHLNEVSKKLKENNLSPTIELAISCWSEHLKKPKIDKTRYGTTDFKDFSCSFYRDLILSCDPQVEDIRKIVATQFLKSELEKLNFPDIEKIFKKPIDNPNKSQDHDYLAFLGFICIAISNLDPNQFSKTLEDTINLSNFQEISKQYFRKFFECEDNYFDSVYEALITKLDYFDDFLKALVIETSKKINLPLKEDNVKSIKADKALGHLITNFNQYSKDNSKVSFMDEQDIKKIALIFALVVGAILTVGGAVILSKNSSKKQSDSKLTSTPQPVSTPKKFTHKLVLMLDRTDIVKNAVGDLKAVPSVKLDQVTVSAISKLTVLQAIWHGSEDRYNDVKGIFASDRNDDNDNLIFIEIEMDYREYDFDKGAGLSNARDGLMKLVSKPNSHSISKIVTRTASDPKLKSQISALYR